MSPLSLGVPCIGPDTVERMHHHLHAQTLDALCACCPCAFRPASIFKACLPLRSSAGSLREADGNDRKEPACPKVAAQPSCSTPGPTPVPEASFLPACPSAPSATSHTGSDRHTPSGTTGDCCSIAETACSVPTTSDDRPSPCSSSQDTANSTPSTPTRPDEPPVSTTVAAAKAPPTPPAHEQNPAVGPSNANVAITRAAIRARMTPHQAPLTNAEVGSAACTLACMLPGHD